MPGVALTRISFAAAGFCLGAGAALREGVDVAGRGALAGRAGFAALLMALVFLADWGPALGAVLRAAFGAALRAGREGALGAAARPLRALPDVAALAAFPLLPFRVARLPAAMYQTLSQRKRGIIHRQDPCGSPPDAGPGGATADCPRTSVFGPGPGVRRQR